jgi:hypothetical protein
VRTALLVLLAAAAAGLLVATRGGPQPRGQPVGRQRVAARSPEAARDAQRARTVRMNDLVRSVREAIARQAVRETGTCGPAESAAIAASLLPGDAALIAPRLSCDELVTPAGTAILGRWLSEDPLAACRFLDGVERLHGCEAEAAGAALLASAGTLERFEAEPLSAPWKDAVLGEAGRALGDSAPQRALAACGAISDPQLRTDAEQTVIHSWIDADPPAAAAWIGRQPDPADRSSLGIAAAKAIGLSEPDLAAQWLSHDVMSGPQLDEAAAWVAGQWRQTDAKGAGEWLSRYPGAIRLLCAQAPEGPACPDP